MVFSVGYSDETAFRLSERVFPQSILHKLALLSLLHALWFPSHFLSSFSRCINMCASSAFPPSIPLSRNQCFYHLFPQARLLERPVMNSFCASFCNLFGFPIVFFATFLGTLTCTLPMCSLLHFVLPLTRPWRCHAHFPAGSAIDSLCLPLSMVCGSSFSVAYVHSFAFSTGQEIGGNLWSSFLPNLCRTCLQQYDIQR